MSDGFLAKKDDSSWFHYTWTALQACSIIISLNQTSWNSALSEKKLFFLSWVKFLIKVSFQIFVFFPLTRHFFPSLRLFYALKSFSELPSFYSLIKNFLTTSSFPKNIITWLKMFTFLEENFNGKKTYFLQNWERNQESENREKQEEVERELKWFKGFVKTHCQANHSIKTWNSWVCG